MRRRLALRQVLGLLLVAVALCALPAGASAFGPLSSFGSLGPGAGQMFAVRGLAVSPDGRIYVSDIGNERVDVFSPNGDFLLAFGKGVNAVDASDICTPLSGCKRGTRSGAAGGFNLPQGLDVAPKATSSSPTKATTGSTSSRPTGNSCSVSAKR